MQMDISFWSQWNPNIKITHTQKKFYGKYLYKIVLHVPGGRLTQSKGNMKKLLADRLNYEKFYNSSLVGRISDLENVKIELLEFIRAIRNNHSDSIHIRVEEPHIQIYGSDILELENLICNNLFSFSKDIVLSLTYPKDKISEDVLNSGAIIKKEPNGYKYKVILRDGMYGKEAKEQLLNYFISLGNEQVKITAGMRRVLNSNSGYIWGIFYYTNDPDINHFVSLIAPGIIANCHEMVTL